MKAIVISEKEFDLIIDKLKVKLTEALGEDSIQQKSLGGPSRTITYYLETFRQEMKT